MNFCTSWKRTTAFSKHARNQASLVHDRDKRTVGLNDLMSQTDFTLYI